MVTGIGKSLKMSVVQLIKLLTDSGILPIFTCHCFVKSKRDLFCCKIGGVPEWPKGADCKSVGSAFVGSNPTPSTAPAGVVQW